MCAASLKPLWNSSLCMPQFIMVHCSTSHQLGAVEHLQADVRNRDCVMKQKFMSCWGQHQYLTVFSGASTTTVRQTDGSRKHQLILLTLIRNVSNFSFFQQFIEEWYVASSNKTQNYITFCLIHAQSDSLFDWFRLDCFASLILCDWYYLLQQIIWSLVVFSYGSF